MKFIERRINDQLKVPRQRVHAGNALSLKFEGTVCNRFCRAALGQGAAVAVAKPDCRF
jgi:hypothetical protein